MVDEVDMSHGKDREEKGYDSLAEVAELDLHARSDRSRM
jgi:hypothetical protein